MTEHKVCIGCSWNHYPECYGTINGDGSYMRIDALRIGFECGAKDFREVMDFTQTRNPLEIQIEKLEARINQLESRG